MHDTMPGNLSRDMGHKKKTIYARSSMYYMSAKTVEELQDTNLAEKLKVVVIAKRGLGRAMKKGKR